MSDYRDRFRDLGAQLNGGGQPLPPPPVPKPAVPTVKMVIDGIEVEPAARLTALAAIRDRHRASARFASDRAAELRQRIAERETRIKLLAQNVQPGYETEYEAQAFAIQSEIDQLRAAMVAASDEADDAAEAAGAADRLFRSCRDFAVSHGAVLPITLTAGAL